MLSRTEPHPERTLRLSLGEKVGYTLLVLAAALLLLEGGLQLTGFLTAWGRGLGDALPGSRLVLCLGDSVTWGVEVEAAQAYPALLQDLLRRQHPGAGWRVINAGVPGINSSEVRTRLGRELQRRRPAVVLIMTGERDRSRYNGVAGVLSDSGVGSEDAGPMPWYSPARLKLVRLVSLLWLNAHAVEELGPTPPGERTTDEQAGLYRLEEAEEQGSTGPGQGAGDPSGELRRTARAALEEGRLLRAVRLLQDGKDRFPDDLALHRLFHRAGGKLVLRYLEGPLPARGQSSTTPARWRRRRLGRGDVPRLVAVAAFLLRTGLTTAGEAVFARAETLVQSTAGDGAGDLEAFPRAAALGLWLRTRRYRPPAEAYLTLARATRPTPGVAEFLHESIVALHLRGLWRALLLALRAAAPLNPHRRLHYLYLEAAAHQALGEGATYRRTLARLEQKAPGSSRALQLKIGWQSVLRRNLRTMVQMVRKAGARPVLLGYAHNAHVENLGLVRTLARQLGVPFVAFRAAFDEAVARGMPRDALLINGGGHPTARGHRLIAGELARALERLGLLR